MTSQRQYTSIDRIQSQGLDVTIEEIDRAEELIDELCSYYIRPSPRAPFYDTTSFVEAAIVGNQVTINTTDSFIEKDYFKKTNIQFLDSGLIYPVVASENNVLTIDNHTGSSTEEIKIFQLGKFPRFLDCDLLQSKRYSKIIPERIRQAATFQAMFLHDNPFIGQEIGDNISETIAPDGRYSYSRGNSDSARYFRSEEAAIRAMVPDRVRALLSQFTSQGLV